MMTHQGTRFIHMVAVSIFLGLLLLAGCDQEQKAEPVPSRPKVISKRIVQPASESQAVASGKTAGTVAVSAPSTGASATDGPLAQAPGKIAQASPEKPAEKLASSPAPVTEEQAKKEQDEAKSVTAIPLFKSNLRYDTKGRVDPFIPLLAEKPAAPAAPAAGEKPEGPKRILTPLEKMDLSQIKLVAVIQAGNRTLAMVEEASGKGYEVRLGTYMGRNGGQVTAIHPDSLTVTESYTDYQGKQRERTQEIKFHKNEGGE